MDDSVVPPVRRGEWRTVALKGLFAGAGFGLVLLLGVGAIIWHNSRPERPRAWDANALIAKEPPGFTLSSDAGKVEFLYVVENTTDADYEVSLGSDLKVMARGTKGTLSQPFSEAVSVPIFVPARQKAVVKLSVALANLPIRASGETGSDFHERLRGYLEEHLQNLASFVIFDEVRHYQISLPRWRASKNAGESSSLHVDGLRFAATVGSCGG